ncbi:MAG: DUF1343 domain-containing protein [Chlorobiaceae bacterium]|nr:DUF1343 domain-containing protein [Chlorobiaceae bacterium]MBA4308810.1 DUF1343 domain-containing protein [Chlorobiaceae bacterium]
MKSISILFFSLFFFSSTLFSQNVKLGIDVLQENNFDILKGKRVGLVTNPTGVDRNLNSTIDILHNSDKFELVALYGPEHGVRGDYAAGDYVESYIDSKTNLPVYSLYGKTRKPSKEMLQGVDVIVYDIQDIGSRSYTYISTMGLVMEACAENNIEFVVLDRPNPLGGIRIEGNIVEPEFISFVSQFQIPYVHGLTVGELAKMLNEKKMLKDGLQCKLTVVPMKNWKREMLWESTGLQWVMTSPHIPYKETPLYYVASGILGELGFISEGVGYTIPFQIFVAEWIDAELIAQKLNARNIEGIHFRPITVKPFYTKHKGKTLHGVQLHLIEQEKVNLMSLQFIFLEVHNELYPDKNPFVVGDKGRFSMFDKVTGSNLVREKFVESGLKYSSIEGFLNKDIESFRKLSKQFYLYD